MQTEHLAIATVPMQQWGGQLYEYAQALKCGLRGTLDRGSDALGRSVYLMWTYEKRLQLHIYS